MHRASNIKRKRASFRRIANKKAERQNSLVEPRLKEFSTHNSNPNLKSIMKKSNSHKDLMWYRQVLLINIC